MMTYDVISSSDLHLFGVIALRVHRGEEVRVNSRKIIGISPHLHIPLEQKGFQKLLGRGGANPVVTISFGKKGEHSEDVGFVYLASANLYRLMLDNTNDISTWVSSFLACTGEVQVISSLVDQNLIRLTGKGEVLLSSVHPVVRVDIPAPVRILIDRRALLYWNEEGGGEIVSSLVEVSGPRNLLVCVSSEWDEVPWLIERVSSS